MGVFYLSVIRVCSIVVYERCFINQGVFYCSIWEVFYLSVIRACSIVVYGRCFIYQRSGRVLL